MIKNCKRGVRINMDCDSDTIVLALKKQIDDFYNSIDNIEEFLKTYGNLDLLFINAHSIKGLAMYYGCQFIKKVFYNYEMYLEKYRVYIVNKNLKNIVEYINYYRKELYDYLENYNDPLIREHYDSSSNYKYHKIRNYKFVISGITRSEFQNIIFVIKDVVLITKAIRCKDTISIYFISNLKQSQLRVLFSSFKGKLVKNYFGDIFVFYRHNLLDELCCYHEARMPKGDYLDKAYITYSIYKGICNLAQENDVFVKIKLISHIKQIDKKLVEVAIIPILEVLKNAFSHGKRTHNQLSIRIYLKYKNKRLSVKIFNKGDRLDIKPVIKNAIKNKVITEEEAKRMPKDELMNMVFDKFTSGSNSVNTLHGHGIGLYAAKKIVNENNGTLLLKNRLDGLEFCIEIPNL